MKSIFKSNNSSSTSLIHIIGGIHDLEFNTVYPNEVSLASKIFSSQWGQASIILLWLSGTAFHIALNGNFEIWTLNPYTSLSIAHAVWDPHQSSDNLTIALSSVYPILFSLGFNTNSQIYQLSLALEILSVATIIIGRINIQVYSAINNSSNIIDRVNICLDNRQCYNAFHYSTLLGLTSILWSGHLVHVSLMSFRGANFTDINISFSSINTLFTELSANPDSQNHISGSSIASGSSILTCSGSYNLDSSSIVITDIIHHHLALGVLLLWLSHTVSTFYRSLGHRFASWSTSHGNGHNLSFYIIKSQHLFLSLTLLSISLVLILVPVAIFYLKPYQYLSLDNLSNNLCFINHYWLSSISSLGSGAHFAIFLIRDFSFNRNRQIPSVLDRIIFNKSALISHLSWVTLFLGFHQLGIYIHNDTVVAFGKSSSQIIIEPVFAQTLDTLTTSLFSVSHVPLSSGDFYASHSTAFALHTTLLIILKGSLDSSGSALIPDKGNLAYGFPCDGPSRGGTCDISAWDSIYLSGFWVLNSVAWGLFYFHWKSISVAGGNIGLFVDSSSYLQGWFRDYLWFNSADLISGYDSYGSSESSVWCWSFLAAHLVWATGFMFLISWRGYWQELLDTIILMHLKTPIVFHIWQGSFITPQAVSIVQARFIGLVHFAAGFIVSYAAFVICSS